MNLFIKLAICICFSLLTTKFVDAQQPNYPLLQVPDPSSPPIAAFLLWHQALLDNDFVTYEKVHFWLPDTKEDLKRQMFKMERTNVPATVKIAEYKTSPNGAVDFLAVGCKDQRRVLSLIGVSTVGSSGTIWRVAPSAWGPPWNATVKLCPV